MLTYLAAATGFQSESRRPAARFAAWLGRLIEAHRMRRAERRNRRILNRLDRRMLADIGFAVAIDAEKVEPAPGLSVQAMVAGAIADRITRP